MDTLLLQHICPPQESEDNSIQICIELGQYGNIDINNQSHLSNRIVQGLINGLEKGKVIHTKKLESAIYNLQGLGGVKAYGIMRPGKNQGESDITIHLEKAKRNNYVLYSENYGSKNSGRYRYGFMADWYGLSSMGDHLSLNMLLSNKEQHNYGIRYEILAGHSGTKLGLGLGRTDYELGSHLSSLGATGLANTYSFFGSTPLWQTSNSSFGFNYGFDYQDMKDEMRSVEYLIKKHSHIFHLGINGFQRQKKTVTSFDLTYYTGILTGDESKISGIPLEIAPEGAYNKLLLNATVVQTFNSYWDLMFRFQGQKAGTNLDSSEKIYLGGANGVRAYPQGEGSGDEGYQTTAEVRYHTKVPGLTFSTYFDIGHVKYTHDTTISGGTTLKGWGVGVSWIRENDFFARIDYARRIGLAIDSTEDARSKQRIWFTIGKIW